MSKQQVALVAFVAPWCGHCKSLEPAFDEAAGILKKEGSKASLVRVDATANEVTAKKFGVQGFPTIKLFMNGEVEEDYEGGRDALDIAEFMRSSASEAAKPRPKQERLVSFTMSIANSLLKNKVKKQLMVFANKQVLSKMQEDLKAASEVLDTSGPNMLILTLNTGDSELAPVLQRFEVPTGTKGPVFRLADTSGDSGLRALRPPEGAVPEGQVPSTDRLVELCTLGWTDGFARILRSANFAPQPLLGKKAKELIGSTFSSNVLDDAEHDSIVFFYMPGCGHCEALKKPFKKALKKFPEIKAFTMDGTKNEVAAVETGGYPTVYFFPKSGKANPVAVSARDKQGLKAFFAQHHTPVNPGSAKDEL